MIQIVIENNFFMLYKITKTKKLLFCDFVVNYLCTTTFLIVSNQKHILFTRILDTTQLKIISKYVYFIKKNDKLNM